MTARLNNIELLHRDEVVAPPAPRACTDHSFELPTALYAVMALCFLGFVTVLSLAFSNHMLVSWGVFAAFMLPFFAIPAIFVRASPERSRALSWFEFRNNGVDTLTGRTPAGEASALVLTLPILIFCWAGAIAVIAATVR